MAIVLITVTGTVGAGGSAAGNAPPAQTATECSFPVTKTDATGTEVTVETEPTRIVTLSPSAAQTVWEIGGRDKVVGVTQYANYLDGAASRANVSGAGESFVNVERVVDLDPDLVLAPNTISNDTVDRLRASGLTVFSFGFQTTIEDVEEKTRLTGRLIGECEGAAETVAWMESELDTVDEAIAGQERPRVLYVFFGYTAGEGTFAHTVIEAAGGRNVAAAANVSGYRQISPEVVVRSDPQWIVVNDGATQIPQTAAYNGTTAVERDQVVVLREEYISQPAPRIVHSVVTLAKALHPEAYERAANGTATTGTTTPTPTSSPTATAASTTDAAATTDTSTPGFGAGVALLALAVPLWLLGRRDD